MNAIKGYCGVTYCDTTRTAQSGENLQELPDEQQLRAELKRRIMRLTEDERKELLVAADAILMMSEEEVRAMRTKREAIT